MSSRLRLQPYTMSPRGALDHSTASLLDAFSDTEEEEVAAALMAEEEALRRAEQELAHGTAVRHAATREFFELESFAQGWWWWWWGRCLGCLEAMVVAVGWLRRCGPL